MQKEKKKKKKEKENNLKYMHFVYQNLLKKFPIVYVLA